MITIQDCDYDQRAAPVTKNCTKIEMKQFSQNKKEIFTNKPFFTQITFSQSIEKQIF